MLYVGRVRAVWLLVFLDGGPQSASAQGRLHAAKLVLALHIVLVCDRSGLTPFCKCMACRLGALYTTNNPVLATAKFALVFMIQAGRGELLAMSSDCMQLPVTC